MEQGYNEAGEPPKKRSKTSESHRKHHKEDEQDTSSLMETSDHEDPMKEGEAEIKAWMEAIKMVNKITVPTLNLTSDTRPLEIVRFIRELDKYRRCGKAFHEQLLTKAFQGELGRAWCLSETTIMRR